MAILKGRFLVRLLDRLLGRLLGRLLDKSANKKFHFWSQTWENIPILSKASSAEILAEIHARRMPSSSRMFAQTLSLLIGTNCWFRLLIKRFELQPYTNLTWPQFVFLGEVKMVAMNWRWTGDHLHRAREPFRLTRLGSKLDLPGSVSGYLLSGFGFRFRMLRDSESEYSLTIT